MAIAGMGDVTYDLQLHANGQISGQGHMGSSGIIGAIAGQHGLGSLLNTSIRCQGHWTYDDIARRLDLDLEAVGLGQHQREVIQMNMQGTEKRVTGRDTFGRTWRFQRSS
jgi:hypothetical protein